MFDAVFDALPGNSILVATDAPLYTIIAVTEGMVHQSGLAKEVLLHKPFFEPFPANPLDTGDPNAVGQNLVYESFDYVIKNKAVHHLDTLRYDLQNTDGSFTEHYWSVHNKPVLDKDGNVLYILHSSEDITAGIKAAAREEEIRDIEKAHELFMQAPAVVAIFKGTDHVVEFANEAALSLLRSEVDIIGKPLSTVLPKFTNQDFPDILEEVRTTGKPFLGSQLPAATLTNEEEDLRYFDVVLKPYYGDGNKDSAGVFAMAHDVTERVVARGKLEESEFKYRTLFDTMDQGFCIIEMIFSDDNVPLDYRFLEVNPVFEKQTGLKGAIGNTARDLVPNLEPHWFELYGRVALTGEALRFDEKSEAMGRWFEVYAFKIGGDASRKVALLFTDITDRKKTENAMLQSEKKLRSMIMQSPVAMCILTGPSFVVEVANDSVLALWGKSRDEVIDRPMFEARPEAQEQGLEQLLEQVYTSGVRYVANEHPVKLPTNGVLETRYINFVYEPFTGLDGNIAGVMAVASEVTGQVKARKKIEENEEKLRIAIEGGELGTYDYFPATAELQWSEKTIEHFGLPPGKPVNVVDFLRGVHLADSESTRLAFEAALDKANNGRYENEYRTIGSTDGRIRYIRSKGKITFDNNGKPIRLTGVTQDITKQKEAEERLRYAATLTENIADAIIGTDMDYKITRWNKGAENLYGHTEAEVLGKPAREIIPTQYLSNEDKHAWQPSLDTVGHWQGEVMQQTKNGNSVYVLASIAYVKDEQGKTIGAVAVNKNITEQKSVQEQIKESEERFRNLADQVPMMIFIIEPNAAGSVSYWNKQWLEYTGQTLDAALGRAWDGIIHPDDVEVVLDIYLLAFKNHEPYFLPAVRVKRHDGVFRWHLFKGNPRYLPNGEFIGFVGVGFDVHEQKLAEEELGYRTALLEAHHQASIDGILLVDAKGKIISYNTRFVEIWNMPQAIVEAKDDNAALAFAMEQLVNPQQFIDQVKSLYENPTAPCVDELIFNDGKIIERQGYPVISDDGTYYAWSWTFRDVTKQRTFEKTIEESEEKFRTLTETLPQLVWMTNEKGVQEYASKRWQEYTGIKPKDEYSWSAIVHPDDMNNISKAWTNSMTTGQTYHAEARLKNKDGEYRWHFVQGEPIRNEEGKILKWIGSFTDIDDQKTLSQRLEKLVAERTKALERSNEDLQQFAHVASHDLKEPVRKIRIFSTLLKGECEQVLPPRALSFIEKIESASRRMYDMIDGVLLYSSFEAMKHAKQIVDLNQILHDILIDLEIVINQKEALIQLQALPQVEGSPVLLHQLFYNLVNNSLKFSRSGIKPVIQITAHELAAAEIKVFGLPANEYIGIAISDNGIGFDQMFAENIFKTFSRLHTKDKYEGTGLGLALCKRITERHGGMIKAEGKENEGAVFTIVLPLRDNKKGLRNSSL
jgi:PAS domain S-box-containing protein